MVVIHKNLDFFLYILYTPLAKVIWDGSSTYSSLRSPRGKQMIHKQYHGSPRDDRRSLYAGR